MTCSTCGAEGGGRFCGSCGAELRPLSATTSPTTAAAPGRPETRLMLDVGTFPDFREGRRCALRFAVLSDAADLLEVELVVRTTAAEGPLVDRGTGREGQIRLGVGFVPLAPGHHELAGELVARRRSATEAWSFDSIAFFVGDRSAPVSVDLSSLRVATFDGAGFGHERGRMLGPGDWRALPLTPEPVATSGAPADEGSPGLVLTTGGRTYTVGPPLARGAVADLYSAWYDRAGAREQVVFKIARDAADNDLLANEARALRLLLAAPTPQAKHLPRLLDQVVHEGRAASFLERCEGLDLLAAREQQPGGVDPRHLIWIARRCLSVLGHAHSLGLLHGNLEPAHVFVRPRDHNVWLLDWTGAVGADGAFLLVNEPWSAPEVATRASPRPSADFHALGQILAWLAGAPPGGEIPTTVPGPLRDVVDRYRHPAALRRPTDAWEEYHALDALRQRLWGAHRFLPFP